MCCEKYYELYTFFYIMIDGICSLYVSKNTVLECKKEGIAFCKKDDKYLTFLLLFCFNL